MLLQLGQVQQQVQQSGPFLELSYVWLPIGNLHLPGHASAAAAAQNKACISAQAAAGYALAKLRDPASRADAVERDLRAVGPSDPAIPPGSSVGHQAILSAVATSSSSSAQVVSQAFSNLQPAASVSLQTAAESTGQRSAAGENQASALGCDVNSSVSGLVTPGKTQLTSLQEASIAKPEDTPSSSQLVASSAHQGLAGDSNHADCSFVPSFGESHPDTVATQSQPQGVLNTSQPSDRDTEHPQNGTPSQSCQPPPCQAPSKAKSGLDCSHQSLEQIPDSVQDCLPQALRPVSPGLTEQPSGFLSGDASVWSIQAPGALSAEPSGCWDDLPDAPLSLDNCLAADLGSHPPLHEHHTAEPSACLGGTHPQPHAEPDPFSMDDLDFDLPPLDSPEQPAAAAANDSSGHAQTHAVLEQVHLTSGDAQQQHQGCELDAQAVAEHVHEQDPQAVAQPGSAVGHSTSISAHSDEASLAEAPQACGSGSMTALLSSEVVSKSPVPMHHPLQQHKRQLSCMCQPSFGNQIGQVSTSNWTACAPPLTTRSA